MIFISIKIVTNQCLKRQTTNLQVKCKNIYFLNTISIQFLMAIVDSGIVSVTAMSAGISRGQHIRDNRFQIRI